MPAKTEQEQYLELLIEKDRRIRYNKLGNWFPDEGPFCRDFYKKHIQFINASLDYLQRAFISANQCGKTQTGAYEMAVHLTGRYPKWWKGKKFFHPIKAWGVSIDMSAIRDVIQASLVGPPEDIGTGMLPKEDIVQLFRKPGSASDSLEKVTVKHISGGLSTIVFKTYEMGRDSFQGTSMDVIWLDEEPRDPNIYSECLTRIVATKGIIFCTFTPLFGMSDVVLGYLKEGLMPSEGIGESIPGKFVANVSWEDVPHLSAERKAALLSSYSQHERDARTKGLPSLGAGAIYPYPEDTYTINPFVIPSNWRRAYGLDVGWNVTSAVWGAIDPNTNTCYIYSEYYGIQNIPAIHTFAIKSKGEYIPGVIDPASLQKGQETGKRLFDLYQEEGLVLNEASNAVEPGIFIVSQYFAAGRLKVFNTCPKLLQELRLYHRDEKGQIVKKMDHGCDALRYLIVSGLELGMSQSDYLKMQQEEEEFYGDTRSSITGY